VIRPQLDLKGSGGVRQVGPGGLLIGRADECGLRLDSMLVSSRHAHISVDATGWWIEDQQSTNGTLVDSKTIHARTPLRLGSKIEIGDETLQVAAIRGAEAISVRRDPVWSGHRQPNRASPAAHPGKPVQRGGTMLTDAAAVHELALKDGMLTIGRDACNDIVINDPNVSRFHAELRVDRARRELSDLGSCNGTRLDGRLIERVAVTAGSEIGIGAFRLVLTDTKVRTRPVAGRLSARGIQQHVKGGACVLQPTDLDLVPGEFVAVIGEAGSGKSTLLKILAGVARPSGGSVLLDDDELALRLPDLGYVPQSDILHRSLTAREALTYGARLRLPPDTAPGDIDSVVERVLRDLDLLDHANTQIGNGLALLASCCSTSPVQVSTFVSRASSRTSCTSSPSRIAPWSRSRTAPHFCSSSIGCS
jgi:pSer/pThr/pTyr-binding forkhead associated (FHA) protein